VALGDDGAVLVDALHDAVDRARIGLVGEPRARHHARRFPARREQLIAIAQIVGGARAHGRGLERFLDHAAFGKPGEEEPHLVRRPAVVAHVARFGKGGLRVERIERIDHIRHVAFEPADAGGSGLNGGPRAERGHRIGGGGVE